MPAGRQTSSVAPIEAEPSNVGSSPRFPPAYLACALLYQRMEFADQDRNNAETTQRKIIHIDLDAFYASVEQRDSPDLRDKPVAVGGSAERGGVAASYEARKFGVGSAMASVTAKRRCPDLVFIKPRFEVYNAISRRIREIFASTRRLSNHYRSTKPTSTSPRICKGSPWPETSCCGSARRSRLRQA